MKKRVLLDTTYILPLFGIPIKYENSKELLKTVFRKYNILINSLSILEARWKANKLRKLDKNIDVFFQEGLIGLTHRENVKIVNFYDYNIDTLAVSCLAEHKDYFDCSILATAIYYADIFLTEDKTLNSIAKRFIDISIRDLRTSIGLSEMLEVKKINELSLQ